MEENGWLDGIYGMNLNQYSKSEVSLLHSYWDTENVMDRQMDNGKVIIKCLPDSWQATRQTCVSEIKLKKSTQSFIQSGIYVTNLTLKAF